MIAKGLGVYWIIGCVLLGMAQGWRWQKCPHENTKPAEALTFVATWPAIIGGLMTAPRDIESEACKDR